MKRVLKWVMEEKIAVTILLLAIGIILSSPPKTSILAGILLYGAILIILFHLLHRLYLQFKK